MKNVVNVLTLTITIWIGLIALRALEEYKVQSRQAEAQNNLEVRTTLENRELAITSLYFSEGGAKYMSIFALAPELPNNNTVSIVAAVKKAARQQVELYAPGLPEWYSITDLADIVWNLADKKGNLVFAEESRTQLRQGYFHAELIIYLTSYAFDAKESGLIEDSDFDIWAAYVRDIGTNPIVLAIIHEGQQRGYMSLTFTDWLWEQLIGVGGESLTRICVLYPQMARPIDQWRELYAVSDDEEKIVEKYSAMSDLCKKKIGMNDVSEPSSRKRVLRMQSTLRDAETDGDEGS